jgi:FAD:protein FMN transferase
VNRDAARGAVVVSGPLLQIIEAGQRVSQASRGAFDVTIGPLVRLWGFHDKVPHIPTSTELAAVRPLVDYQSLVVDAQNHTIRFAHEGMEIDLGGIAKGFAVEVAANVLGRHGLGGFVDAGGNQYLLGTPAGKTSWTVGIKNPDDPKRLIGVVDVKSGSVSTSANDANFLAAKGRTYGHLLDPHTLQPSTASLSATVVSEDGTLADAMSKAAFILGPRQGIALIDATPGMAGVIAYRTANGSLAVAVSQRAAWRPVQ